MKSCQNSNSLYKPLRVIDKSLATGGLKRGPSLNNVKFQVSRLDQIKAEFSTISHQIVFLPSLHKLETSLGHLV